MDPLSEWPYSPSALNAQVAAGLNVAGMVSRLMGSVQGQVKVRIIW